MFCQWTYVNGYFNTFTTGTTAVGATVLNVNDTTGLVVGQSVFIWDGVNDEYVTVAGVTDTTITLAKPTNFAHGSAVNVSALPADVKQAVIHFVVALVKQRGQGGIVIGETGEPMAVTPKANGSAEDMMAAYDLLDPFRVVWSRS